MKPSIDLKPSTLTENRLLLEEYFQTLSAPMESYMEDQIDPSAVFSIHVGDQHVGFALLHDTTLWFFYMQKAWRRLAQLAFERLVIEHGVSAVYFNTADELLTSLTMDWDFVKEKAAYFFADAVRMDKPASDFPDLTFRPAELSDQELILRETGGFFHHLERDTEEGKVFVLLSGATLLGCGLIEPGRYFRDCCSVGMTTCERFRSQGVGKLILWHLKEWCYEHGFRPVAGCWYYNTLSAKTLEASGFIKTGRGIRATLTGKEVIPDQTGNPPTRNN